MKLKRLRITFYFVLIFLFAPCNIYGAEKDSIPMSKNPEINKYLSKPMQPPVIADTSLIESPAVREYRQLHTKQEDLKTIDLKINPELLPEDLRPRPIYDSNPYSKDWSNSGIIAAHEHGYLAGFGSHNTIIGMATTGVAGVSYTHNIENLTITGSAFGAKMNVNGFRFNNFGVSGKITYDIADWLAINAYGSYGSDNNYLGMSALSSMGATNFGGTLTFKLNEKIGIDVGAERYYDMYSRAWRTRPVIAPYVFLGNSKLLLDFGWILEGIIDQTNNNPTMGPPR